MISPLAKGFLSALLALLIAGSFLVPMLLNYVIRPWPGVEIHITLLSDKGRVFTAENLGLSLYAQVWAVMPPGSSEESIVTVYEGRVLGNVLFIKSDDIKNVVDSWIKYITEHGVSLEPPLLISLYIYNPSTGYVLQRVPLRTITYNPLVIASGKKIIVDLTVVVPLTEKGLELKIWENRICERRYYWLITKVITLDDMENTLGSNVTSVYHGEKFLKTPVITIQQTKGDVKTRIVMTYNGVGDISFHTYIVVENTSTGSFRQYIAGPCLKGDFRIAMDMDVGIEANAGYIYLLTKPLVLVMEEYYYDSCAVEQVKPTGYKQIIYLTQTVALHDKYIISGTENTLPMFLSNIVDREINMTRITVPQTPLDEGYLDQGEAIVINDIIRSILKNSSEYMLFSPITTIDKLNISNLNVLVGSIISLEHGLEGYIRNIGEEPIEVYYNSIDIGVVDEILCREEQWIKHGNIAILYFTISR
ncbi:hypothetical protein J4526_06090 [Desulfurococcaceae archaeon MEX13E-LK6-19]|nr:hypothetical protein J4526_06090 [Desulfurococcaceae archaeon MEX13E-LK6-19]